MRIPVNDNKFNADNDNESYKYHYKLFDNDNVVN